MTTLLKYHTVQCNPTYYWENNDVANKIKKGEITTYEQYEKACKSAGCNCYNQDLFNRHLEGK